jgi:glycogen synthase kinase 3 beta
MTIMNHPNVIALKHCFYSTGDSPDQIYLNLVMEYIPETIYRTLRNHTKAKKHVPLAHVRCYMYQICRSIAHIHSLGICHRDIKPQNLLLNPRTHVVKLCDFGSAKRLVESEPNVSYICSRYYRAPELVCDATEYTTAVDVWSLGCVMAELLLGCPLFPGESSTDQLTEIIKTIGTPSPEELHAMNPGYVLKVAPIVAIPWSRIFRDRAPAAAVDLIAKFLCYTPGKRLDPFDALAHPFFDDLRRPGVLLPNGHAPPNTHNWTDAELGLMRQRGLAQALIPAHVAAEMTQQQLELAGLAAPATTPASASGASSGN